MKENGKGVALLRSVSVTYVIQSLETEFCDQLLLISTWGWGGVQRSLVRDMLVTKGGGRGLGIFGIGTCFN